MAKKTDNYPLIFLGGGLVIWLSLHTIWNILFEDWVKHQFERLAGHTVAEVIERFGAIGVPALVAMATIWFLLEYQKSSAVQPDNKFFKTPTVYCETKSNKWESGKESDLYENTFYLVVGNSVETGQTLRRVQARIFHIGEPVISPVKDTEGSEIDIRHGEFALFEIGKIVSANQFGMFSGRVSYDPQAQSIYGHNVPLGHLTFEVSSLGKRRYGLANKPQSPFHIWSIWMVVSADDALSMQVRISIDLSKDRLPVSCESLK